MRIIDAHNHPDWHGHDFNKSLENMDRFGIEKTWLLSWESPHSDYCHNYSQLLPSGVLGSGREPVPFTRCLSYKERAPERFILGYCPDPREPDACRRLIAAHDIYGAQVCGELKVRMMYDNPDALMLFHVAASLKMPVTFHLQYDTRRKWDDPREEWYGGSIDTLERVLQARPRFLDSYLRRRSQPQRHVSRSKRAGSPRRAHPRTAPQIPESLLRHLRRVRASRSQQGP